MISTSPVAPRARRWLRHALALLMVVGLLLLSAMGWAQLPGAGTAAAAPPPAPPAAVRTGTTSIESTPPKGAPKAAHPPPDAPRLSGELPRVPHAPSSYNTYDGGWIHFAYPPSVRERVQPLIAKADQARAQLTARLGEQVLQRVSVYVARTPGEMATLAPDGAPFPKYAAGVAYGQIGLVLLSINPVHPNDDHDLGEIFRHELAHVALHDAVNGHPVPRWFNEGFAVFASGESSFVRLHTLWTATLANNLIPLRKLDRTFPANEVDASVAYAESADVVRYLLRQQDRHRFVAMIQRMKSGEGFQHAMESAYDMDIANLEYDWRQDVAKRYTFWPVFFSGGAIWMGVVGLVIWSWKRRRRRDKATLERWAKEEAAEDDLKRRIALANQENARVHIVLARHSQRSSSPDMRPSSPDSGVPKVEHDGQWHTLH